jgi:signal transduction protein with GAF and PtsI domain
LAEAIQHENKVETLLIKAILADGADMGNVQLFDSKAGVLTIIAQKGFKKDFLEHFKIVKPFDTSACGRSIGIGSTITINDVTLDTGFIPHRAVAKSAGFRAVKSVPIIHNKKLLGIISTHFREPKWNWEKDTLQKVALDLAAVMAKV